MITFENDEIQKTPKEVQQWYKQHLKNTIINHPIIGEITFKSSGFDEITHFIPAYYIPILLKIDQIILTAKTKGKLIPPNKQRKNGAIGFHYLYNTIKYADLTLNLCINILVDKDYKKILYV